MVDCDQHGMGYCNISALLPAMNTDSGKLSRKVAFFDPDSSLSAEDKRCFQRLVAFGRSTGVRFLALSLFPGHKPAHLEICLSVGKRLMSVPITEIIASALALPIPGTSSMAFTAAFSPESMKRSMSSLRFLICLSSSLSVFLCGIAEKRRSIHFCGKPSACGDYKFAPWRGFELRGFQLSHDCVLLAGQLDYPRCFPWDDRWNRRL